MSKFRRGTSVTIGAITGLIIGLIVVIIRLIGRMTRGAGVGGRFGTSAAAVWSVALLASALFAPWVAVPARAQGSRKDDVVFNAQGRPMAGANVRVCTASATGQPCTPLANIYSNAALTQALANPTATDGLGNYSFYAAPGRYMIEISGPGITTKQLPNVILPNDPSAPTFTSLTTTSGISAFSLSLSGNLTVTGSTAVTGALTVGGAPVPSTAQANTWSAAQTFSQDVISGSRTPWMDVRANGATCNGSTDDATSINPLINNLPAAGGGTLFLPHGCVFTPPSSYTIPNQYWETIGLGGLLTVKAPLVLPTASSVECMSPALHGGNAGGFPAFMDRANCGIIGANSSISPVLSVNPTTGENYLKNILVTGGTGTAIVAGTSSYFDNVFAQTSTGMQPPLHWFGGFGGYFDYGGWEGTSSTFSALFDGCVGPNIIDINKTFMNGKGFSIETAGCSSSGGSNNFRSNMQLMENVAGPFCDVGLDGYDVDALSIFDPQMADGVNTWPTAIPLCNIRRTTGTAALRSPLIVHHGVNTGTNAPFFNVPPGDGQYVKGAMLWGCTGSCPPSGLDGRFGVNYLDFNDQGGLTVLDGFAPSIAGVFVAPMAAPFLHVTPSASGGTLATGLYCYKAAGVNSHGAEGMASADFCANVTGPTGSVAVTLPDPNFVANSATTYHIYRTTGGSVVNDFSYGGIHTALFTNNLSGTFTDTGAAGSPGIPTQLAPRPDLVAATDYLNPVGPGYIGMAGCMGVGQECAGGNPGDLQAKGIVSGTNVPTMAGAAAGDYPCFNTSMVKCRPGTNVNTQSGGAYTIAPGDRLTWVKRTNTATSSDTLPLPSTTGFDSGFGFTYLCWGTAACVLTNPGGTFTVNGVTGLTALNLQPGDLAMITTNTNTSYNAEVTAGTAVTRTICSGTVALGTSAIASGAAAATVTVSCPGLLSTDNIAADFNGSPLGVTGYAPSPSGMLTILKWPSANTINVAVVNNTGGSITPGAITLNYRATR